MQYPPVVVKVWGDFACFTRPEMKVERVSYEVMTPSAARGVLEAIFWKPEFTWRIQAIHVLKPIRHFSILRNEVNVRASPRNEGIDINECHTPRHTLALRDVAYLIEADIEVASGVPEDPAKYRDQFRRRLDRGQCYHRPYLGCREFAAGFGRPEGAEEAIQVSDELGLMLLDIEYRKEGEHVPRFFSARLEEGVLRVPEVTFNLPPSKGGAA